MSDGGNAYAFRDSAEPRSPQRSPRGSLPLALAASLAAGIVGGILWGLIVKWSNYEVGIVAWAIGFLAGTVVVTVSRGGRGPRYQAIAVVGALVGVLLGKYLSFAFAVQEDARSAGISLGVLSSEMFRIFRENLGEAFGLFDVLWIGFAVYTAWKLARSEQQAPATV